MSKGLDALEKVEDFYIDYGGYDETGEYKNYISLYQTLEYQVIKKELERLEELEKAFVALSKDDEKAKEVLSKEIEKNRALEIIKNKRVDMLCFIHSKSREQYNEESSSDMYLTVEEYNFLKEVLL